MKSIFALFFFALFPFTPMAGGGSLNQSGPRIGLLTHENPYSPAKKSLIHISLFEFKGGRWHGADRNGGHAKGTDIAVYKLPEATNPWVFFDGKTRGRIALPPKQCAVDAGSLPKEVLSILGKHDPVLTSTAAAPRDPDGWKPIDPGKAQLPPNLLQDLLKPSSIYCYEWKQEGEGKPGKFVRGQRPKLSMEKIYAPKAGSRLLVVATKEKECTGEGGDGDFVSTVLFFRDSAGHWKLTESNGGLVDAGDFNGDGKVEGMIYAASSAPDFSYALVDMNSFETLASVGVSGIMEVDPCGK